MSIIQAIQVLVGLALLAQGALTSLRPHVVSALAPQRAVLRFVLAAGCIVAGAATLAGVAVPFLAFFAACAALIVSAGTMAASKTWSAVAVPALLMVGAVGIGVGQPLGLKVLALPKAEELPYAPAASRVLKTYDEGVWFEGIAAGPDGTLYLAANRGLDFNRGDYWRHARGEVIARGADGRERTVFKTPEGAAAGVIAVAADSTLYMTSNGAAPGIWRILPSGKSEQFVRLPAGAWPNGIDFGPDGKLYAADSNLGVVWRVDPATGNAERAVDDRQLLARPFVSLAPGANGLHFRGRDMIVTVSDRTTVLSYPLEKDEKFGAPRLLATGIPGDDFAVGADGSLYITTHPYNTLVRVSASGERTVIADARQHIVGATDAVFGRGASDLNTIYVVTDGGAFTGGPKTRGELVEIKLPQR